VRRDEPLLEDCRIRANTLGQELPEDMPDEYLVVAEASGRRSPRRREHQGGERAVVVGQRGKLGGFRRLSRWTVEPAAEHGRLNLTRGRPARGHGFRRELGEGHL
jgi:hypothetical protein